MLKSNFTHLGGNIVGILKMIPQANLAFLSLSKGEVSVSLLFAPGTPRLGIANDGVLVKARVEVHCNVVHIMTNVDGKAVEEAEMGKKRAKKRGEAYRHKVVLHSAMSSGLNVN